MNCYDGNRIRVFNHFHNDSISYGNLYVTQMIADGEGTLFLLTSTGLFQFELETEKYYLLPVSSPSAIAKGKRGVWITDNGKLYLYDKSTRNLKLMFADVNIKGANMLEDTSGILWIALKDRGVIRIEPSGMNTLILPDVKVRKLIEGNNHYIWAASQKHGVFCISSQGIVIHN